MAPMAPIANNAPHVVQLTGCGPKKTNPNQSPPTSSFHLESTRGWLYYDVEGPYVNVSYNIGQIWNPLPRILWLKVCGNENRYFSTNKNSKCRQILPICKWTRQLWKFCYFVVYFWQQKIFDPPPKRGLNNVNLLLTLLLLLLLWTSAYLWNCNSVQNFGNCSHW